MRHPLTNRLAPVIPAAVLILAGTMGLGAAELMPVAGARAPLGVLVVGHDAAATVRVIAAADGRLVSYGGWLGAAVAVSDDADFAAKLYRAGATLVFRADGAVGCGDLPQNSRQQDS